MIFNNSTQYAKIWKVTRPKDNDGNPRKYIELQISTYEKTQDEEKKYIYSNWWARAIGHAFNSLKDLKEGKYDVPVSLSIKKSKFTNESYTAQDGSTKSAFKFLILEADLDDKKESADSNTTQQKQEPETSTTNAPKTEADGDPW